MANNQIKDAIYNALNLSISSKMLSNLSAESPLRDFVSSIGPAATNPIANFGSIQNQPSATAMQNVDYRMSPLQEILNRLQLSGGYQSIDGQDVRGGAYGGRIGYSFPAGSNSLDVGLSGSGFSVNTPLGRQRQNQMTGADLSYNFGRNKLSAAYDRFGDNLFRLSYQRQFD